MGVRRTKKLPQLHLKLGIFLINEPFSSFVSTFDTSVLTIWQIFSKIILFTLQLLFWSRSGLDQERSF